MGAGDSTGDMSGYKSSLSAKKLSLNVMKILTGLIFIGLSYVSYKVYTEQDHIVGYVVSGIFLGIMIFLFILIRFAIKKIREKEKEIESYL